MAVNRRTVLAGLSSGAVLASMPLLGSARALASLTEGPADLALVNLHTGERFNGQYRTATGYNIDALAALNRVLRDHRTGEEHSIDPALFDWMDALKRRLGGGEFSIISGYRSPKTNATLRAASGGVAKRSWHMQGKAIDLRLSAVATKDLRRLARADGRGGVGYYPKSDFVHIDTGAPRFW